MFIRKYYVARFTSFDIYEKYQRINRITTKFKLFFNSFGLAKIGIYYGCQDSEDSYSKWGFCDFSMPLSNIFEPIPTW